MKKVLSLMTLTVIALSFAGCSWFEQTKPAATEGPAEQVSDTTATLEIMGEVEDADEADSSATLEITAPDATESKATLEIVGEGETVDLTDSKATLEIMESE